MNAITICDKPIPVVEYQAKRVITFAIIDQVHERPEGTASRVFKSNRTRFIAKEDFYLIDFSQKDVFRPFGIDIPPRGLIVLTETGYLMLVKSFTDDLAWQVQRQLVNLYFRIRQQWQQPALPATFSEALRLAADQYERAEQLQAENQILLPKADFADRVAGAEGCHTVREAAQIFRTGERRLFVWLRNNGFLARDRLPYQRWLDRDLFRVIETPFTDPAGIDRVSAKTVITAKGLQYLQARLDSSDDLLSPRTTE